MGEINNLFLSSTVDDSDLIIVQPQDTNTPPQRMHVSTLLAETRANTLRSQANATDIATANDTLETQQNSIATLSTQVGEATSNTQVNNTTINAIQNDVSAIRTDMLNQATTQGSQGQRLATNETDISTLQTALSTAQMNLANAQTEISTLNAELLVLRDDLQGIPVLERYQIVPRGQTLGLASGDLYFFRTGNPPIPMALIDRIYIEFTTSSTRVPYAIDGAPYYNSSEILSVGNGLEPKIGDIILIGGGNSINPSIRIASTDPFTANVPGLDYTIIRLVSTTGDLSVFDGVQIVTVQGTVKRVFDMSVSYWATGG